MSQSQIRTAEDAEHLVHGIDKHSEGWAQIETREVPVGKPRRETWRALFSIGIGRAYVVRVARKGHKAIALTPVEDWNGDITMPTVPAPDYIRQYLLLDDPTRPHWSEFPVENLRGLKPGDDSGAVAVRWINPLHCWVTFTVEHQRTVTRTGILVGAEVGESGDGPTEFIPFPTTERAVLKALSDAVSYANDLAVECGWHDAEEDEA